MKPQERPTYLGPVRFHDTSPCQTESEKMSSGFQALVEKQKLSIEVVRAIQRIEEALSRPHRIDRNFHDSQPAVYSNFAEALPSMGRMRQDGEPHIDSLLCLGLVLYCSLEFSNLPVWQTVMLWSAMSRRVRTDLTLQILSCKKRRDEPEEACLQWLCMIAIGSWRQSDQKIVGDGQILIKFVRGRYQPRLNVADRFFHLEQIKFEEV
jgi:hypothetical protein